MGYLVTEKILSTTKDIENKKLSKRTFGNAFSIAPSSASKNGIYTSQIILSLCKEVKPDIVILIDSLSCKNINFLGRTFQINTCGLTPGCEVGNKQPKICKNALKTPVLAIGLAYMWKVRVPPPALHLSPIIFLIGDFFVFIPKNSVLNYFLTCFLCII